MIPAGVRGDIRTNLSYLPSSPLDFTNEVQEIIEEILFRGLRFNSDRVEFNFHENACIIDSKGIPQYANFYPLDKELDKKEIEAINKWRYGFSVITTTAISEMVELLANTILRKISQSFDKKEVAKVIVHFAPGHLSAPNSFGKLGYCYVGQGDGRNAVEVETSFYIEECLYEGVNDDSRF